MMVEGLLEKTCQWKEYHDTCNEEAINMEEIVKRLDWAMEALKET